MLGERLDAARVAQLLGRARANTTPWLTFDQAEFKAAYNRRGFTFSHRLAEHPLFSLEELVKLCKRRRDLVLHRAGNVPVDADFDRSYDDHAPKLSLDEALEQVNSPGTYVMISNAERDETYGPAIEAFMGEIAQQTQPIDEGLNWWSTYIFISSQAAVTPYHMDREMNFLLQVKGEKHERLWSSQVMGEHEKEQLFGNGNAPRPQYTAALEAEATHYRLTPGVGVHHPFIAPHTVETLGGQSISLAITFRTRGSDRTSDAYRAAYRLRKLGLALGPIGSDPLRDRLLAEGFRAAHRAYSVMPSRLRARLAGRP